MGAVRFVSSSTASTASNGATQSINAPTSVQNGNVLFMAVEMPPTSGSGITPSLDATWFPISISPVLGGTGSSLWIWSKFAANEASTYTITLTGGTANPLAAGIMQYSGVSFHTPTGNVGSNTGTGSTSVAVSAPVGILSGGVSLMFGGCRPDGSQTALTITMPGTSRIASFYTTPAGGFGSSLAASDTAATASGNMTISAASEVSTATIILVPQTVNSLAPNYPVQRASYF